MITIPPQTRPVDRNPTTGFATDRVRQEAASMPTWVGIGASGGVQASLSACAGLTGMARSLCYASQYGISV